MTILIIFLIHLVLAIIVSIVVWVKGNSDMYKEDRQETTLQPENKEVKKQNVLTYRDGNKEYNARFEDGVVYAMHGCGEYVIGYYACEDGEWKVRCASDKGEIGSISKSVSSFQLIYFNRLGDLARYKNMLKKLAEDNPWLTKEEQERQHNNAVKNIQLSWCCAEIFGDFILDINTQEVIASSNSRDVIGNAAAFICLQYDVVMEGKYHDFYSPIK